MATAFSSDSFIPDFRHWGTYKQHGDLINVLSFFKHKESWLKYLSSASEKIAMNSNAKWD
jgi:hypothetical protein